MSAPTDFFLLAGFLGSGKTTLLQDFLGQGEAADTAVIVNDVGQINIDGAVLAATDGGLDMAMLNDGCVCCSVGNDLLFTIEALLAKRAASGRVPFRRIILECSGLSRPGPIIRALGGLAAAEMRVSVLSTYDCSNDPVRGGPFDDAVAQLAAARTIILTKLDRVDDAAVEQARGVVAGINPLAAILCEPDRRCRAMRAFTTTDRPVIGPIADTLIPTAPVLDHPRVEVFLAKLSAAPPWPDLSDWLENLAGACGDRLLRVKGLVQVLDCPDRLLLQGVGGGFDIPRRMPGLQAVDNAMVIIARDTAASELRELTPDIGLSVSCTADRRPALICS